MRPGFVTGIDDRSLIQQRGGLRQIALRDGGLQSRRALALPAREAVTSDYRRAQRFERRQQPE